MKIRANAFFLRLCLLLLSASLAFAQPVPTERATRIFSPQELDQMLAPIALYPDALLSQILMAATYPLEVVKAAHWVAAQANSGLSGEEAVRASAQNGWEPSVNSLVAFPHLLAKMEENIDWTERLGDAFLAQQAQVMDTVQSLRRRAMAQGSLTSGDRIVVTPQAQTILIEPANPQIIYVPYYDPNVVYGTWWWANHPPVYWAPWPGYYVPPPALPAGLPGYATTVTTVTTTSTAASALIWGSAIIVGTEILFGGFDWRHHRVHADYDRNDRRDSWHDDRHDSRPDRRSPPAANAPQNIWQHDPSHRRGLPYDGSSMRPLPQPMRSGSTWAAPPTPTIQTTTIVPPRQDIRNGDIPPNPHRGSGAPLPMPARPAPSTVINTPPVPPQAPVPKKAPAAAPLPSSSPGIMRSSPAAADSGADARSPGIFNQTRQKGPATENEPSRQNDRSSGIFRQ